jgi:hypothetical protein
MSRSRDGYARHAERFGTEFVFETAAGLCFPFRPDLSVRELGYLSLQLQRITTHIEHHPVLDERGRTVPDKSRPICDEGGNPIPDRSRPIRDETGRPVLDGRGEPTFEPKCEPKTRPVEVGPTWRLPRPDDGALEVRGLDGADFALMLVAEGVSERDACRMAMVSRRTVQRRQRPARELLEQVASDSNSTPEAAFQSGETATNRGSESDWSSGADLSLFEAQEVRP